MRQANASPMWDMLYKNEVAGKKIIDLPAPWDGTPEEMLEYCNLFAEEVGKAYKVKHSHCNCAFSVS